MISVGDKVQAYNMKSTLVSRIGTVTRDLGEEVEVEMDSGEVWFFYKDGLLKLENNNDSRI